MRTVALRRLIRERDGLTVRLRALLVAPNGNANFPALLG